MQHLSYHKIPDNFEFENIVVDDDFSKINLEINNLSPYKITFNDVLNYEEVMVKKHTIIF